MHCWGLGVALRQTTWKRGSIAVAEGKGLEWLRAWLRT
jgi:hypothetical protein